MSKKIHLLFVSLFMVIIHFLFIINDLNYWDSALYEVFFEMDRFEEYMVPWRANGRPIFGYFYWYINSLFGGVFGFRVITVVSYILNSVLIYKIMSSKLEYAIDTALFASIFPFTHLMLQSNLSFTNITYTFFFNFWLVGILLIFKYSQSKSLKDYFIAIIFICLGLLTEALIPTTMLIAVVFFLKKRLKLIEIIPLITSSLILVYFLLYGAEKPGMYGNERRVYLDLYMIIKHIVKMWSLSNNFIIDNLISLEYLVLLVILSIIIIKVFKTRKNKIDVDIKSLILFFCLFLSVSLPYAVAGRRLLLVDWDIRHLFLPVVMIGAFWSVYLMYLIPFRKIRTIFYVLILLIMIINLQKTYLKWMGRNALDKSFSLNINKFSVFQNSNILLVSPNFSTVDEFVYRSYEWSALFFRSHKIDQQIFFLTNNPLSEKIVKEKRKFLSMHNTGKIMNLNQPTYSLTALYENNIMKIGISYTKIKMISSTEREKDFLRGLSILKIKELGINNLNL